MEQLEGIAASPGIGIGTVYLYSNEAGQIPYYTIDDVSHEQDRFAEAVERTREVLHTLQEDTRHNVSDSLEGILESHLMMLDDPDFLDAVSGSIETDRMNAETVLLRTTQKYVDKLAAGDNEYLRERSSDIRDVAQRILNQLLRRKSRSLADLSEESVIVADDIMPSDAMAMNKRVVRAIAMDAGGKTSHTAILARSFDIPAVLGVAGLSRRCKPGDTIVVDGSRGLVVIDPDAETLDRYHELLTQWRQREVQLMRLNALPAETQDGKLIALKANIETPEEVDALVSHGADGVGLYRSEFLFLQKGSPPDEEEQYQAYRHVLEGVEGRPVTIRTLDVGGDKIVPSMSAGSEKNPILGWRAIRFSLAHPDVFRTQLRALLRASVHGQLKIMFPMISGIEELEKCHQILGQVKQDLSREGHSFDPNIQVGIMIEVPSAAMTADILARKSAFFSIGTNDLIQYTLAVDRGNSQIAYLYEPFHPGVLRMLRMVIDNAHRMGIACGMCGEMAGDPAATIMLLGLGLDEFSMSAFGIPQVKRIIRSVTMAEAEELVGVALEMRSHVEVDRFVRNMMEKRFNFVYQ